MTITALPDATLIGRDARRSEPGSLHELHPPDLLQALRAGTLRGAALDVIEEEPLPADHPLRTMPNVLVTPHVAGVGPGTDDSRYGVLLDNARRFASGQPLRNVVDKATWF